MNICSLCGIIITMTGDSIISILIFANTIVIMLILTSVIFLLVKMNIETAKFTDIESSLGELSKVIEQQSRLLEFISRKG